MVLQIRVRCSRASSKNTSIMAFRLELYSARISSNMGLIAEKSPRSSYSRISPLSSPVSIDIAVLRTHGEQ